MREKYIKMLNEAMPFNLEEKTYEEAAAHVFDTVMYCMKLVDKLEHEASVARRADQARRNANAK